MEEQLQNEKDYKAVIRELKEKSEQLRQKNREINMKFQETQEELNSMLKKSDPAERH